MKRLIVTLFTMLAVWSIASAQTPDISVTGTFTASGQSSTPVFVGGTGAQTGVVAWRLTYFVDGVQFTAASAAIQGADAANAGGCPAATYATITTAGSSLVEVLNPAASAAQGNVGLKSYYPCIRATLSAVTGSAGTVTWQLAGWRNLFAFPITATVTPSGTQDVNLIQIKGVAVDTNSGVKSAGTQRVVLATDQPALTTPMPENLTQIAGTSVTANTGNAGAGTQRVVLATDQPAVQVGGGAAAGATPSGNPVPAGFQNSAGVIIPEYCTSRVAFTNPGTGSTQLVAVSGSTTIRVCELFFSGDTLTTVQLVTGTGSSCTSPTAETGVISGAGGGVFGVALDFPSGALVTTAAKTLCLSLSAASTGGGYATFSQR